MTNIKAVAGQPLGGEGAAPGGMSFSDRAMFFAAIVVPGIAVALPGFGNFLVLPLTEEFHVTRGEVLFFLGIGTVSAGVMGPVAGRLLTRRAPWVLMLLGAFAACAELLGASLAPWFLPAVLGFIVAQAFVVSFSGNMSGQTIIVRTFPERLGIIAGAQTVAAALAGIAISLIVAPVLAANGWRITLVILALALLVLLLALILLCLRGRGRPRADTGDASIAQDAGDGIPPTSLQILSAPAFWFALFAMEPAAFVAVALSGNLGANGCWTAMVMPPRTGLGTASDTPHSTLSSLAIRRARRMVLLTSACGTQGRMMGRRSCRSTRSVRRHPARSRSSLASNKSLWRAAPKRKLRFGLI